MSVPVTVSARLYSLPDDVLRALATFVPLSDLLVLVRCSRHFRMELQSQLNHCLDRLFVVTHDEEYWSRVRSLQSFSHLYRTEQRVLEVYFSDANVRGNSRAYCFTDGRKLLGSAQRKHMDGSTSYYITSCWTKSGRYCFESWLRYRCRQCEQYMATEAHGIRTDFISGVTSDH
jgi:hypothetical protein